MRNFLAITLIASAVVLNGPAIAQDIKGKGRVIDGIRLWVGFTKVRLCGLSLIPPGTPKRGAPGKTLGDLTQHQTVECVRVGNGTPCDGRMPPLYYGYVVAQCFVNGVDVVSTMICSGDQRPEIALAGRHYHRYLQGLANARSPCHQLR